MDDFVIPNILFIRGVFPRDCKEIDDVVTARFTTDFDYSDEPEQYEPTADELSSIVPRYYTGIDEWPVGVNVRCHVCFGPCTQKIVSVPKSIESDKSGKPKWPLIGAFDSWTCAGFYIRYYLENDSNAKLYTAALYRELERAEYFGEISPGLPPWYLKECGGHMTREEYKAANLADDQRRQKSAKDAIEGLVEPAQVPVLDNTGTYSSDDLEDYFDDCIV